MNWKYMLAYVTAASTLVACGGESDSKAPDININVEVIEVVLPSDSITSTSLPIEENFDTATDAPEFFSSSYRALASESENSADDGFYYSTAGVFLADGSPDPDPSVWITADADPHFRLGDGRFTIAQFVSAFVAENAVDPRKDTTPGTLPPDTTRSWGELNLSSTFTVSFCVVDRSEGGLFQIFIDNNTSGSGNSIHGSSSRPVSVPQSSFTAGQRASFEITDVGTPYSFIQMRADSGGWIVLDDLVIENAASPASAQADCSTKTTLYGATQDGNLPQGTPFSGLPLDVNFGDNKDIFFGSGDADFLAISDEDTNAFYKVFSSASRILINDQGNLFFGNAGWLAGAISAAPSASDELPNGDIDLSAAYSITMEIETVPTFGGNSDGFQVMVDNSTSTDTNSIHGSASRLINLQTPDLAVGTLVINVPGDVTMNGDVVGNVPVHRGTENSFIGFRCPGNCGDPTADPANGIEISSIVVDYTGAAFVPAPPPAPTAFAGDSQIEVEWFAVGGASAGYDILYSEEDDSASLTAVAFSGNPITDATTATITGLTNNTPYFVFVRAKNATGNGDYSLGATATPTAGPPATAPANVTLTPQPERLTVSWEAVAGATEYDVAYNTTDSVTGATIIADVADTSTTLLGLTAGTDYFVFVRASNIAGESDYSASVSAQPLAQPAANTEREWSNTNGELNEVLYASILASTTPQDDNNNLLENTSASVNGLNFFSTAGTSGPLRHRGTDSQEWNYNGSSYVSDDVTPAPGMAAPAQRVYIGVPVDSTEPVTIVVNSRNSSGSANAAVRLVFIGGTTGNVLCIADASSNAAADTTCAVPAAHGESEVRIVYSREGTGSAGMHLSSISRLYPGMDRTWSNNPANGGFNETHYSGILLLPPPQDENNNIAMNTDLLVNGLHFFTEATTEGPLRHRGTDSQEWNYNGSSYTSDVTTPAVGMAAPAQRVYIGVPVDPAEAVDIIINSRNSSNPANASVRIVFIGGTSGNVLCVEDGSSNDAADTTCSLLAAHGESEVRVLYSREGTGSGGMHLSSITRDSP